MLTVSLLALLAASGDTAAKTKDGRDAVCRYEKQTNSRFAKKVCRIKSEMEARALRDGEFLREAQTGASRCTVGSAC